MVLECTCGFQCGSAKAFEKHLSRFPDGGHAKVGAKDASKFASNESVPVNVPPQVGLLDQVPDSARSRDSADSAEEAEPAGLTASMSPPPLETTTQPPQQTVDAAPGQHSRQTTLSQPKSTGGGLSAAFGLSPPPGSGQAIPDASKFDSGNSVQRPPPIQVPVRRSASKQSSGQSGLSAAFGLTVPTEPLQKPAAQESRGSSKNSGGLSGAFGLSTAAAPKSPGPAGPPRTPPGVPKLALSGVNAMRASPQFGSGGTETLEDGSQATSAAKAEKNDGLRTTPRRNITPRGTTPRGEPAAPPAKTTPRMIAQEEADKTREEEIQKAVSKIEQEWKDKLAEAEKREDDIADRASKHRKEMEQARKERERADKEVQQLKRDLAAEVEKVEQARAQVFSDSEKAADELEKVKLDLAAQDVRAMKLRAEATDWLKSQLATERAAAMDVMNKLLDRRHSHLITQFEGLINGRPCPPPSMEGQESCVGCSGFGCALCGPQKTGDGIFDSVVPMAKLDEIVEDKSGKPGLQLVASEQGGAVSLTRRRSSSHTQSDRSSSKDQPRRKTSIPGTERSSSEDVEVSPLQRLVMSSQFEIGFGVCIMLNAVVMAIQVQYEGDRTAHLLGYKGMAHPDERWAGAGQSFLVLEWLFGALFTVEVGMKIAARRCNFFKDTLWNFFDLVIVSAWIVDRIVAQLAWADLFTGDPTVFRMARLARLARLLRVMRWLQIVDPLILMVKAVKASVSVLFWSVLLMVLLISLIAMVISITLEPWVRDPLSADIGTRVMIFESWGTYTRAMESMCEITIGNFGPPTRELMNGVAEYWGALVLIYKLTIGFAVVQVITSVFIQQTFKVASRDEEVMIKEKASTAEAYQKNLLNLFEYLDESGDGMISKEEFMTVVDDPRVTTWLAALDVEVQDVTQIFDLLAGDPGEISQEDFLRRVKSLKGNAKGTDMMVLSHDMKRSFKFLEEKVNRINMTQNQNDVKRGSMKALKMEQVQSVQRVAGTPLQIDTHGYGGDLDMTTWEFEKAAV